MLYKFYYSIYYIVPCVIAISVKHAPEYKLFKGRIVSYSYLDSTNIYWVPSRCGWAGLFDWVLKDKKESATWTERRKLNVHNLRVRESRWVKGTACSLIKIVCKAPVRERSEVERDQIMREHSDHWHWTLTRRDETWTRIPDSTGGWLKQNPLGSSNLSYWSLKLSHCMSFPTLPS